MGRITVARKGWTKHWGVCTYAFLGSSLCTGALWVTSQGEAWRPGAQDPEKPLAGLASVPSPQ